MVMPTAVACLRELRTKADWEDDSGFRVEGLGLGLKEI